jgi:repressor of nif and glnA expression
MDIPRNLEEFKVQAGELVEKIKELIHEGNVRRIIIKDASGHTFMEVPVTVAAIGVIAAPVIAAIGALAGLVANFHVVVERNPPAPPPPAA